MKLKLNLFKQTKGLCGPSSLRIILDYFGTKYTEKELAKLIGATKQSGCTPEQIIKSAKEMNFEVTHKINSSIEELKWLIKNKTPPIIYWEPVKRHGHYSVLAGIDKNYVYIANPRKIKLEKLSLREFEEKWHDEFGKKGDKKEIIILKTSKKNFRKAVFIVVYKKEKNKIEYLLLKRKKHWIGWEFPKGGIDEGETEKETAEREVFEETGLKPKNIKQYKIKGKYLYPKLLKDRPNQIGQTYTLFSAEISEGEIKIDEREHSRYEWFQPKEAMKKLTWRNQKRCLKYVNEKLGK